MEFQVTFSMLFSFLFFLGNSFALPAANEVLVRDPSTATTSTEYTVYKAYEFPNVDTFIQKMAIRSNGNVLVTLFTAPEVWEIDPFTSTAELIYTFPKATGAFGISEVTPDVFAVAVGNFSFTTFSTTPGSYSVWSVNMNGASASVHKITAIPAANMLNGVTVLPTEANTVLVSDAGLGVIYNLNTITGAYYIAIDIPDFKPNASAPLAIGVASIHVRDGYLYFENTYRTPLYSRVPICDNGSVIGPVGPIASTGFETPDGFALDVNDNAWMTTDVEQSLVKISLSGVVTLVAGAANSTVLLGPTDAAFGRTSVDLNRLYITTNGGMTNPPPTGVIPGGLYYIVTSTIA